MHNAKKRISKIFNFENFNYFPWLTNIIVYYLRYISVCVP